MMWEQYQPFASAPFQLQGHRPGVMNYDSDGEPEEPYGYVSEAGWNFDQTKMGDVDGGNYYFNLFGLHQFDRNGTIRLEVSTNGLYIHGGEYWEEEIDHDHEKGISMGYGIVECRIRINTKWEDHIPFKGVKYKYKFKKRTIITEQNYRIIEAEHPELGQYPYSVPDGGIVEISNEEEDVEWEVQLPDDFDEGKRSYETLYYTIPEKLDKKYIFPGWLEGEKFHDETDKYGYDAMKHESFYERRYVYPGSPDFYIRLLTKWKWTAITYDLSEIVETCSPGEFYNQD